MSFLEQLESTSSDTLQQPLRLANPTPFHVQKSLLRQSREKINAELNMEDLERCDFGGEGMDITMHSLSHLPSYAPTAIGDHSGSFLSGDGGDTVNIPSPGSATPIGSPSHITISSYGHSPYSPTRGFSFDASQLGLSRAATMNSMPTRRQTLSSTSAGVFGSPPSAELGGFQAMPMPINDRWLDNRTSIQEPDAFPGSNASSLEMPSGESGVVANLGDSDDPENQKQAQLFFEKRRRRRESHNAVERRRRDNINERIQELSALLPDNFLDGKPNKGVILKKSVDYIRNLKIQLQQQAMRNRELEAMMQRFQNQRQDMNSMGDAGGTSEWRK
ncbi:uncharacterized protein VTP21DRAFT_1247 [Calcarisporiella thermophila]|uniref:uncharacterized protein n=1 Tax=Calcarisporiella thermophila TaxID=911321 RepID=UPI0037449FFA